MSTLRGKKAPHTLPYTEIGELIINKDDHVARKG